MYHEGLRTGSSEGPKGGAKGPRRRRRIIIRLPDRAREFALPNHGSFAISEYGERSEGSPHRFGSVILTTTNTSHLNLDLLLKDPRSRCPGGPTPPTHTHHPDPASVDRPIYTGEASPRRCNVDDIDIAPEGGFERVGLVFVVLEFCFWGPHAEGELGVNSRRRGMGRDHSCRPGTGRDFTPPNYSPNACMSKWAE